MERRRAVMIDTRTGSPLDPDWQPTLELWELEPANELMRKNRLSFQWQWIPQTAQLSGSIDLKTAA